MAERNERSAVFGGDNRGSIILGLGSEDASALVPLLVAMVVGLVGLMVGAGLTLLVTKPGADDGAAAGPGSDAELVALAQRIVSTQESQAAIVEEMRTDILKDLKQQAAIRAAFDRDLSDMRAEMRMMQRSMGGAIEAPVPSDHSDTNINTKN